MAIQGISGAGHNVTAVRAAYAVSAVAPNSTRGNAAPLPAEAKAVEVRISSGAELLGRLHQLHDADPKGFKRLMGELADSVQDEAEQAEGGPAQQLGKLAERFAEAAKEGNLTPLVPTIESGRARVQYQREQDALVTPSETVRELFRGFVDKVNAVLPASTGARTAAR